MTNKKLLLVSANIFAVPYPVYPLGLSYIASYLKSGLENYEIKIFDFIADDKDKFIDFINEFKPDHVGISLRNVDDVNSYTQNNFIEGYKHIVESVRKYSKADITIGGAGFSIYPQFIFEYLKPDFAIYGEGEESYLQLLNSIDNNRSFESIESLIYSKNGNTIQNDKSSYFKDLELNLDEGLIDFYWQNSGMLSIQTKRGCPFSCIYCTYPIIDGT